MLWIDQRVGSVEMAKFLAMIKLPIEVTTLGYGDFAFLGNGEGGVPVSIGIERKALTDWVSSFYSGRFAGHQVPGLLQCYQVVYVVIEGIWRVDVQTGLVMVPKGASGKKTLWEPLEAGGNKGLLYRDMEETFLTFEHKAGILFRRTGNKPETCRFLNALYHWWTDKQWEEHRSHLRFKTLDVDKALLVKPSLCRQMAATLPGIGWVKSGEVASHFKTVYAMVQAGEQEWTTIPGIGKTMAQKIVGVLRNGGVV
jgi:ERCC4-type nuclease